MFFNDGKHKKLLYQSILAMILFVVFISLEIWIYKIQ